MRDVRAAAAHPGCTRCATTRPTHRLLTAATPAAVQDKAAPLLHELAAPDPYSAAGHRTAVEQCDTQAAVMERWTGLKDTSPDLTLVRQELHRGPEAELA
ncbi:hypothetical protein [Streptomyces hokutonensis]|uniref:hypothetical protein n=1 Tax=Streptomyces hokutonensis TaxID=1306990 RepID=UPI00368C084E